MCERSSIYFMKKNERIHLIELEVARIFVEIHNKSQDACDTAAVVLAVLRSRVLLIIQVVHVRTKVITSSSVTPP